MDHQALEERWLAVLNRDPSAAFCYAVTSTGIYCRPACPSRRPKRENVRFFADAASAEAAGFRPCRRCLPQSLSTEQRVVAEVKRRLEEGPASLADLGEAVGMSPYHLQRLFKRATGLSPKQYADSLRAARLKAQLKQGATVTEAIYEAGYGSVRSAYTQAQAHLGMTPAAYKNGGAGAAIRYACADTALGRLLVAASPAGVCALRFGEEPALVDELRSEFPGATLLHDPVAVQPFMEAVNAHLAGRQPALELPLDLKATAFQQRVWAALQAIPYGEVRSYREVAEQIGEPTAVRAVARACASNPVALAIPCHRVVRSDGTFAGFRWGLDRKQALLRLERGLPKQAPPAGGPSPQPGYPQS